MRFLSNILATIIGIFVFTMIFFFGIIIIGAAFGKESETVVVENNSVIELDLSEIENDYAGKFSYKDFDYFESKHDGLFDVIRAIEVAKTDENIKGISILNDESNLGMAQTRALRAALEDFKKSKKFVYAYSNVFSQKEYYLNSVANKIYINPVGELELKGLSAEVLFFKDFQDKSGVKMEVIRHGKYKSAVEPFLENQMSDANREQTKSLLNSVWNTVAQDISKSRNISIETLNTIANTLGARTPEMAKNQKLVDVIAYEDVYHDNIRKLLKVGATEKYNSIGIKDYAETVAKTAKKEDTDNRIAIIYAQGEITNGEGDVTEIGEGAMRRSLEEARNNTEIKAVVLRINSPGGNALTSDLIWREIELTKKIKPVVVSMGDYAASGGYYIACNANKIFAEPSTITGSIGVFGALPNFTQLTNKIGIHVEQVNTHANAADYSVFKPLDPNFRTITQEGVERVYNTFVSRVANGRKMSFAQVDAIAQGRVWTGAEAIKIGLVDALGGMNEAVAEAAKLAKIKTYRTKNFPEYEKNFEDLLSNLGVPFVQTNEDFIKQTVGIENYNTIQQIKSMSKKQGIQASLPFQLKIK